MLFLCGGKASFKRDPISVGLLFLSICPWFPAKVHFNKSHLQVLTKVFALEVLVSTINTFQATRHLYVLAVEWRWLRCVDVDTGQDVDVEVEVP